MGKINSKKGKNTSFKKITHRIIKGKRDLIVIQYNLSSS